MPPGSAHTWEEEWDIPPGSAHTWEEEGMGNAYTELPPFFSSGFTSLLFSHFSTLYNIYMTMRPVIISETPTHILNCLLKINTIFRCLSSRQMENTHF